MYTNNHSSPIRSIYSTNLANIGYNHISDNCMPLVSVLWIFYFCILRPGNLLNWPHSSIKLKLAYVGENWVSKENMILRLLLQTAISQSSKEAEKQLVSTSQLSSWTLETFLGYVALGVNMLGLTSHSHFPICQRNPEGKGETWMSRATRLDTANPQLQPHTISTTPGFDKARSRFCSYSSSFNAPASAVFEKSYWERNEIKGNKFP